MNKLVGQEMGVMGDCVEDGAERGRGGGESWR